MRSNVVIGAVLIIISILLYLFHFLIFKDSHHILIYLLGDIAFLPIEVLFVTLIIHQVLNDREKRSKLEKLNMVIGTFFSEVGTELLKYFLRCDKCSEQIGVHLIITPQWSHKTFKDTIKKIKQWDCALQLHNDTLPILKSFLLNKRDFLLVLLENPNLLEHDEFTDLLWAIFHLTEELSYRPDLDHLTQTDREHLIIDMKRAYIVLIQEWIHYMNHIKIQYPYLFSLAMRLNPFDKKAHVEIK